MGFREPANAACAVALWFFAARFIKLAGARGAFSPGLRRVAVFAATPLAVAALVEGVVWALDTPADKVVESVALQTAVATMLDGLALAWAHGAVYSRDEATARAGGAWLLWGVGLGLAYALKHS